MLNHILLENGGLENFRIITNISALIQPLSTGAVLYLILKNKKNEIPRLTDAFKFGIDNWGKLIIVNIVSNLIIGFSFLLLIIPGIYFISKFAFIDAIVVSNDSKDEKPRHLSGELTDGIKGKIVGVGTFFLIIPFTLSIIVAFLNPINMDTIYGLLLTSVIDCFSDILSTLVPISMFILYSENKVIIENEAVVPTGQTFIST